MYFWVTRTFDTVDYKPRRPKGGPFLTEGEARRWASQAKMAQRDARVKAYFVIGIACLAAWAATDMW